MPGTSKTLINATGLGVQFDQRWVLKGVDIQLNRDEIVTLIGPNGSGKSTLVRCLLGLQSPSEGKVQRGDQCRIGYMPQKLTVSRNLPLTVARFLKGRAPKKEIDAVVQRLAIDRLLALPLQSLSGGEYQRVLLARALLGKPDLLVLDEPVQGVDVNGQIELYGLIADLRHEMACGVLMISHDLHLVMAATDHVVCLNHHVCCSGHPETVVSDPSYRALFGEQAAKLAIYTHHHDHHHDLTGAVVSRCEH